MSMERGTYCELCGRPLASLPGNKREQHERWHAERPDRKPRPSAVGAEGE